MGLSEESEYGALWHPAHSNISRGDSREQSVRPKGNDSPSITPTLQSADPATERDVSTLFHNAERDRFPPV